MDEHDSDSSIILPGQSIGSPSRTYKAVIFVESVRCADCGGYIRSNSDCLLHIATMKPLHFSCQVHHSAVLSQH